MGLSETRIVDPLLQIAEGFTTLIGEWQLFVLHCANAARRQLATALRALIFVPPASP